MMDWRRICSRRKKKTNSTALHQGFFKKGGRFSQIEEDLIETHSTKKRYFLDSIRREVPEKLSEMKFSTANIQVSTASPPKVSTAIPYVYTRRSAKDKGKTIMEEPPTLNKVKKRTQVQTGGKTLQEEEERLNLEATTELQRQLNQRHEVPTQSTQSQGID
ncbi:hypothetical protein Tco_0590732 [Tanacetum coccineum]